MSTPDECGSAAGGNTTAAQERKTVGASTNQSLKMGSYERVEISKVVTMEAVR